MVTELHKLPIGQGLGRERLGGGGGQSHQMSYTVVDVIRSYLRCRILTPLLSLQALCQDQCSMFSWLQVALQTHNKNVNTALVISTETFIFCLHSRLCLILFLAFFQLLLSSYCIYLCLGMEQRFEVGQSEKIEKYPNGANKVWCFSIEIIAGHQRLDF